MPARCDVHNGKKNYNNEIKRNEQNNNNNNNQSGPEERMNKKIVAQIRAMNTLSSNQYGKIIIGMLIASAKAKAKRKHTYHYC